MTPSDYRCLNLECGLVFEYWKEKRLESFPSVVECERCGSDSKRIWKFGTFNIARGKLGNYSNGYNTSIANKKSELGTYKGVKIKQND